MRNTLVVTLVVVTLSAVACGSPYASLGVGRASVHDDAGNHLATDSPSTAVNLGFGVSHVAIEGTYTSYSLVEDDDVNEVSFASRSVGLALRGSLPLAKHLLIFGHGGVLHTSIDDSPSRMALSGNGRSYGGGLEYRVDLVLLKVSAYADYTRNAVSLSDDADATSMDQTASIVSVGARLSL